ncbi:MAG: hypothetical protein EXS37_20190 [Opitutus sp.]|nr:hypothetical protein [Opitutus sp.]
MRTPLLVAVLAGLGFTDVDAAQSDLAVPAPAVPGAVRKATVRAVPVAAPSEKSIGWEAMLSLVRVRFPYAP